MKRTISETLFAALVAFIFVTAAAGDTYSQETPAAKVGRILAETGISATKVSDTVWTMNFQGKAQKDITVVASVGGNTLVVFTLVAGMNGVKVEPEMMRKLLGLNGDVDRVKIGIDKDGDLFVRIDLSIRILDKQELKENVEQVAAATDQVFAALAPYRTPAK